jgi:TIR domain
MRDRRDLTGAHEGKGFRESLPMSAQPSQALEVFFSYAHRDEALRDELVKHLSLLQHQGVITAWHDRKITAGIEWAGAIDAHLQSAQIILLLVSADFMASAYCYDMEMQRAMTRHEAKEARVIPVILRPVVWQGAPFGKLQALPTGGNPITTWSNQDTAFVNRHYRI